MLTMICISTGLLAALMLGDATIAAFLGFLAAALFAAGGRND
jgi:hypothetical protein